MNNDLDPPKYQPQDALRLDPSPAEASDSVKSEFLGSMGHELRNPLSNILAQAETLAEGVYGPLEPPQQKALAAIQVSARQLLQLIADVVDIGRIEAGLSPLVPSACNLHETSAASLVLVAELARSRSVQIHSEILPPSLRISTDARRLQQIITELLSAAVLSTPTGGQVHLRIAEESGGLHLQTLGSTGHPASETAHPHAAAGISAPLLSRIGKVKPIGLALLQHAVKLHGGSMTASETAAHEVSLSIHLPLNGLPAADPAQESPVHEAPGSAETPVSFSSDKQPTILIADDQPALISVTRNYLESIGFQVITARDGSEAVQQASALQPDLILMDVRMPVVDGLTAIRQIRSSADPKTRAIAIVSLSGHASAADKEKCLAAGATAYLNKPFGVRELDRVIADHIRPKSS